MIDNRIMISSTLGFMAGNVFYACIALAAGMSEAGLTTALHTFGGGFMAGIVVCGGIVIAILTGRAEFLEKPNKSGVQK